jgi:hypothetical protein
MNKVLLALLKVQIMANRPLRAARTRQSRRAFVPPV